MWLMVSCKNHELPPQNTLISSNMAQYKPSENKRICTRAMHHILIIHAFKKLDSTAMSWPTKKSTSTWILTVGEAALLPRWRWFRWIHLNPSLMSKGHLLEALLYKPTPPAAMLYLPNPSCTTNGGCHTTGRYVWKVSFIFHPFASEMQWMSTGISIYTTSVLIVILLVNLR